MTTDPSSRTVAAAARLRAWLERERRIAVATQSLRQGLHQGEFYTDLRKVNHQLSAMSATEASLILATLERQAVMLHRGELAEHLLRLMEASWQPETAVEAYRALFGSPAKDWLCQTRLHRALTERVGQ